MSFAKFNHSPAKFDYELPKDAPYKKLEELYDKSGETAKNTYNVRGLFISTKGKFGDHPVIVSDDFFIDCPKHMTADVREILGDNENIDAINAGKVAIEIYQYESSKYNKTCYGINWIDVEQ